MLVKGNRVLVDDIKEAIWDCGGDRASGLNGFSFQFLKHYWDILGSDVVAFMQEFFFINQLFMLVATHPL